MTCSLLLLMLIVSLSCYAQYSDKELYEAYLTSDLSLWQEYINSTDWESLSKEEKKRMLNYQYGFTANVLSQDKDTAKRHLQLFEEHVNDAAEWLSPSSLACYRSAYAAYKIKLGDWRVFSLAKQTFCYADEAVEIDSLNPLALTLKANVDMYAPKAFGGNKEQALHYFLLAEKQYRERGLTLNNWNFRALQLCIAQCYEKTGDKEQAIAKCYAILAEEPNYEYIRHVYFPKLLGQAPTKPIRLNMMDSDKVMDGINL